MENLNLILFTAWLLLYPASLALTKNIHAKRNGSYGFPPTKDQKKNERAGWPNIAFYFIVAYFLFNY